MVQNLCFKVVYHFKLDIIWTLVGHNYDIIWILYGQNLSVIHTTFDIEAMFHVSKLIT